MNVANLTGQVQAQSGLVNSNAATATTAGQGTPPGMFAMQMGNALLSLEQPNLLQELPEGVNPEDLQEMGDLMAMLGAMLNGIQPTNPLQAEDGTNLSIEEVGQQLAGKLTQFLGALNQETQQQDALVSTLVKQGLSQNQATDLVDALKNLTQDAAVGKTQQGSKLVKQATDLLAQFGVVVEGVKSTSVKENKAQAPWGINAFAPVTSQTSQSETVQQNQAIVSVQSMRLNHALSKYQAETLTNKQTIASQGDMSNQATISADSLAMPQQAQGNQSVINAQTNSVAQQAAQGYNVNAEHFGKEVSDVFVRQMKVNGLSGVTETKLILHPQALGQVNVKIVAENGVITAHFIADNAASKDIIDNQLSQLRTALVQQGLTVDKLEVTHQPENQQQQQQFDMNGQREQARDQAQQQQNQRQKDDATDNSFDAVMQTTQVSAKSRGNIDVTL